jgi:GTP-binding protein
VVEKEDEALFTIAIEKGKTFVVYSDKLEGILGVTAISNTQAWHRFHGILENVGVIDRLRKMGCEEGDTVRIAALEFEFFD